MTPTPEQAQAAMERLRRQLAANPRNHPGIAINVSDLATLLTLLEASARALEPFAACAQTKYTEATGGQKDSLLVSSGWIDGAYDLTMGDFREAARVHALITPKGEG